MIKWSGCFAWRNNRALPTDLALATGVRQGSDQLNEMLHKLRAESLRPLKYHSNISEDKVRIPDGFKKFGGVLVSIKCIDEGVGIPSVSHAFILASSQNPRQFIGAADTAVELRALTQWSHSAGVVRRYAPWQRLDERRL